MQIYLYEEWYGLHAGNLASVDRVSGHNVKRAGATLYDFLHANAILKEGWKSVSLLCAAGITHVTGFWDINGWNLFCNGLFTFYYYYYKLIQIGITTAGKINFLSVVNRKG